MWLSGGGEAKDLEDVDLSKFWEETKTDPWWIYDKSRAGPGSASLFVGDRGAGGSGGGGGGDGDLMMKAWSLIADGGDDHDRYYMFSW